MSRTMKSCLIAAAITTAATTLVLDQSHSVAQAADRYWNNHWTWYDSSYRPHYYRQQTRTYYGQSPNYGYGNPNTVYRQGYGYDNGYGNGYNNVYVNPGYRSYSGGGIGIGPLQLNWR